MNTIEHLLTCLGEEGSEVAKDCSKALRFGLDDRNVLNPTGPTNRERLVAELNDLIAVSEMLVERQVIPKGWLSVNAIAAKRAKVEKFMEYAVKQGTLQRTRCNHYKPGEEGSIGWQCSLEFGHTGPHDEDGFIK